jgi:hypothetical protein
MIDLSKYDDDEYFPVKKKNRREKREKIEVYKEAFMKLNGRGLITDVLPAIGKRARKEREK